jgi:hypothetical protein
MLDSADIFLHLEAQMLEGADIYKTKQVALAFAELSYMILSAVPI